MNEVKGRVDRIEPEPAPAPELSAQERQVLARVKKQAEKKRSAALRRYLKNPPLFFVWPY